MPTRAYRLQSRTFAILSDIADFVTDTTQLFNQRIHFLGPIVADTLARVRFNYYALKFGF